MFNSQIRYDVVYVYETIIEEDDKARITKYAY